MSESCYWYWFVLIFNRTVGKASSETRLYFAAHQSYLLDTSSDFEGSLNARASYLCGQGIYGDAILASIGYTWKSKDLFYEDVSVQLYYRSLLTSCILLSCLFYHVHPYSLLYNDTWSLLFDNWCCWIIKNVHFFSILALLHSTQFKFYKSSFKGTLLMHGLKKIFKLIPLSLPHTMLIYSDTCTAHNLCDLCVQCYLVSYHTSL